jgi:3-oxoacyl-[acyl-carrier protein] reductase
VSSSVLITGGSRGIGHATARAFLDAGHRVAVTVRGEPVVPDGLAGALAVRCDVADPASVDAAVGSVEEAHGPVDVLVANAGITRDTLLLRMSDDDWSAVLDTNLSGAFHVVRRTAKGMLRARRGRVVLVSSVVAMLGSPGQVNYAASKAGLVGLARSLAREVGSRGITANVVAPGFVETDMTAALDPSTAERYREQIPLGRFASAEEVAAVVRWLAGPEAAYITGAVIPVDGGLGMGH